MTTPIPQFIADALSRVHPQEPDLLPLLQSYADKTPPLELLLAQVYRYDRAAFIARFLTAAYQHPRYTLYDATTWTLDNVLAGLPPGSAKAGACAGIELRTHIYGRDLDTTHQVFLSLEWLLRHTPTPEDLALPARFLDRIADNDPRQYTFYFLDGATHEALRIFLTTPVSEAPVHASSGSADQLAAQLFDQIVTGALTLRASDIHLVPRDDGSNRIDVLFRINGSVERHRSNTLYEAQYHDALIRHLQSLAALPVGVAERIQQGMFTDRTIHWRLQILPCGRDSRPGAVLRKNDPGSVIRPIESLFVHPTLYGHFHDLIETAPAGFVLVTGVTGSGKTTTLYSMLHAAIQAYRGEKIVRSIEDPIEVPVDWMIQTPVTATEPAPAIFKALLRADPDWIFVGEIRDRDMLIPATHAALSGHLTFSSFHSAGVIETLARLNEMGATYKDLARVARLILSQTLVKTVCPACRVPHGDGTYLLGPGCENCRRTRYAGRLAITEYLLVAPEDGTTQAAIAANDKQAIDDIIATKFLSKRAYAEWAVQRGLLARNDPQLLLVS